MLFRQALVLAALAAPLPALAQQKEVNPFAPTPDHLRRYTECMKLARHEPLKALPAAEKWMAEGGELGARHCVAIAMFEAGRYVQAARQLEAIERDMGGERPGLRAELLAQAGQAWAEADQPEDAAKAQSKALALKTDDPDLWVDRGLSYATLGQWPRAISDFERSLQLKAGNVETRVLLAAAWRNAGDPTRALAEAARALQSAPDHSGALLEHGFALLARGERTAANADFHRVLKLVPGTVEAKRAEAGLRGELPTAPAASRPEVAPKR
ncbi:MAG: tetratricopeptide repeat protein [Proteobacteria bacterium]|nr:tetratricopeptide repeat protein [Pseudomonadota bacterium]